MNMQLWQSVWLSVRIAFLATAIAALLAVPLAYINTRSRYRIRGLIEGLLVLPMVLPPTVVGYLIILFLGSRGVVGSYLHTLFSYSILFRMEGATLAAALVAFPLLYLPTRAAFAAVERETEDVARLMGANRFQVFWHVSLPMARRGLTSGVMLAFARALGEFGATVMVFGIREKSLTLPISIYLNYEQGEMKSALPAVVLLCLISIAITLLYNRSTLSRQD